MSTSIKTDFYEAINEEWLKETSIPADKASISSFHELVEKIEKQLRDDLDALLAGKQQTNTPEMATMITFYQLATNFTQRDTQGMAPIRPYLDAILALESFEDFQTYLETHYFECTAIPFTFSVEPDLKDATTNALFAYAPSLILPDKSYYEADHQMGATLRNVFADCAQQLLEHLGMTTENSQRIVSNALAFDSLLAPHVKSSEEMADMSTMYNPQSLTEFATHSNVIDFSALIEKIIGQRPAQIIVTEPAFYEAFDTIVTPENFEKLKSWLLVTTTFSLSGLLDETARTIAGKYQQALSGNQEITPKEKAAFYLTSGVFDQIIGDYYGKTYFGETAKHDVEQMIQKMIAVYQKRLANNDWLQVNTREKALLKLGTLGVQVGYPEDIPAIFKQIQVDPNGTVLSNTMAIAELQARHQFAQWNQTVDRSKWEMSADTVNAYYNPSLNMIVFPAAILQAPFYSLTQSSSANYGGIGAVIAHEISHAFDNNGALFDEFGNMNNWWSEADLTYFKSLAQKMIDQFDGLPFGNSQVNGTLTVSENIADAGGLSCALEAAQSESTVDLNAFFSNWARIWRTKANQEYTDLLLTIDVHAPAKLRANMQPRNLDAFYTTFDIAPEDEMYLAPEKRIHIW